MLIQPRVSDLKNFEICAQFKTMGNAAVHLGMTQPSLSESIIRLESTLGVKVFFRTRIGISLTSEGRLILEKTKFALLALSQIGDKETEQPGRRRTLHLGCHPVVGCYVLPKAIASFQNNEANLNFILKHGSSRVIQSEVQAGKIDVGIVINAIKSPDLVIKKKESDIFAVWRNPKKANLCRLILDPELFQSQYILRRWKTHPQDFIETTSLELAARLVNEGIGYGLLPIRLVDLLGFSLFQDKKLPSFKDEISIIHRPEFGKLPYEKNILMALQNALLGL